MASFLARLVPPSAHYSDYLIILNVQPPHPNVTLLSTGVIDREEPRREDGGDSDPACCLCCAMCIVYKRAVIDAPRRREVQFSKGSLIDGVMYKASFEEYSDLGVLDALTDSNCKDHCRSRGKGMRRRFAYDLNFLISWITTIDANGVVDAG
ncbi:uncharacterized protein C8R40DRAFT_1064717 [Lentinula edodes]|uniref:uncharacterized protein n=1 Tax=Lentinula edodes TaxID=5353 RepID=UPI001E8CE3FA|nr:uncharacterized protein C8R40DRAFT_1064717 [Lentinula edodes]KAH7880924.1 hypothetical protein C8R40DRAFT_1064717 [Lentinula edodes]